jgi:hypothetical protein
MHDGRPVFIETCKAPTLLVQFKRCDLAGLGEDEARARLAAFLAPAARPTSAVAFPGGVKSDSARPAAVTFPGAQLALSNIPVRVPLHFLGYQMSW